MRFKANNEDGYHVVTTNCGKGYLGLERRDYKFSVCAWTWNASLG